MPPFFARRPKGDYGPEDAELDGLRRLDEAALASIHQRYYPEVYQYARYRLADEHAAEDITAEVFTRLLEAVKAGRGPKTTLRGWLMGTASNLVSDHYRVAYRRPWAELDEELPDGTSDLPAQAEQREQARLLVKALAQLTPEQQHVLALRFANDYSLEETAAVMGKNANAIKALQFRAVAALRKIMLEAEVEKP